MRHLSGLFTYANTAGQSRPLALAWPGLDWKQGKFDMQGTSLHCPREGREREGKGQRADKALGQRLCSNEQLLRQPINVTLSAFKCEDWTNSALIPAACLLLPSPPERWVGQAATPVSSPKCQFIKSNWHVTYN